jgi:hypothetical protein
MRLNLNFATIGRHPENVPVIPPSLKETKFPPVCTNIESRCPFP